MPSRPLDRDEDAIVQRLLREMGGPADFLGPPLSVTFAVANTKQDVVHGMTVIPDGYELIFSDAEIHATPGVLWTNTVAYLQANAANAHAILRFRVLRQAPTAA